MKSDQIILFVKQMSGGTFKYNTMWCNKCFILFQSVSHLQGKNKFTSDAIRGNKN